MEEDIGKKYVVSFLKEYEKDKNKIFDKVRLNTVMKLCERRSGVYLFRRARSIAYNKLKQLESK